MHRGGRLTSVAIKRRVSVEALLRWTYQKQKADVLTGKGLYATEAAAIRTGRWINQTWCTGDGTVEIAKYGALGIKPDGSRGPLRGIPAALHPDAEVVHDITPAAVLTVLAGYWELSSSSF